MEKETALRIIELLSAIESWALSRESKSFPDYLHENLANILEEMRKVLLDDNN